MFIYYNANPYKRLINDCTVRAISLATDESWSNTYMKLSDFARVKGFLFDDVRYIDEYLDNHFERVYKRENTKMTVEDFIHLYSNGVYLITMSGHITCAIDGVIYDTFYPGDRIVWEAYRVKEKERH